MTWALKEKKSVINFIELFMRILPHLSHAKTNAQVMDQGCYFITDIDMVNIFQNEHLLIFQYDL